MKDLQDMRDLLAPLDPLDLLDLLVLSVTPERGALLVGLVFLELMGFLDLLELHSCCLSASGRVEETRGRSFLHRRLRLRPSYPKPGWL